MRKYEHEKNFENNRSVKNQFFRTSKLAQEGEDTLKNGVFICNTEVLKHLIGSRMVFVACFFDQYEPRYEPFSKATSAKWTKNRHLHLSMVLGP